MPIEYAESNPGSGGVKFAVDNVTEGAVTLAVPYVKLISGADGSNQPIPGDQTNGLDVDVTRVQGTVAVTQSGSWTVNSVQSGSWSVTADTELPPAATLADATANPTLPGVSSFAHFFNGTSWDRARGDIANGLDVDVTRVQGTVAVTQSGSWSVSCTQSGAWTVTADTELPVPANLADSTANPTTPSIGSFLHAFNGVSWDRVRGDVGNGIDVDVTRVQGTVAVTQSGTWTVNSVQSGTWNVIADTELPAAAALGDAAPNPTAPAVGAHLLAFNGTSWDRARGDTAHGIDVDVTRVQGTVSIQGPVSVVSGLLGDNLAVKTAFVNATSSGNTTIVAAVSGKKIRVIAYRLQAHDVVNVKFVSTGGTDLTFTWKFDAREGAVSSAPAGGFEFETPVSQGVNVNLSAAVQVGAQVIYVEV